MLVTDDSYKIAFVMDGAWNAVMYKIAFVMDGAWNAVTWDGWDARQRQHGKEVKDG